MMIYAYDLAYRMYIYVLCTYDDMISTVNTHTHTYIHTYCMLKQQLYVVLCTCSSVLLPACDLYVVSAYHVQKQAHQTFFQYRMIARHNKSCCCPCRRHTWRHMGEPKSMEGRSGISSCASNMLSHL